MGKSMKCKLATPNEFSCIVESIRLLAIHCTHRWKFSPKYYLEGPTEPYKCFMVNSSSALPKSIMRLEVMQIIIYNLGEERNHVEAYYKCQIYMEIYLMGMHNWKLLHQSTKTNFVAFLENMVIATTNTNRSAIDT